MKLVVGLGNPGREYERTRHNVGFEVVEELARRAGETFRKKMFVSAQTAKAVEPGREPVLLVKPLTYMNRSGHAVRTLMGKSGMGVGDVIVVVDDAELERGRLRIRMKGGAGAHNGLKSIVQELGSQEFIRVRVGIGATGTGRDMVDHVLSRFDAGERPEVEAAIRRAADAVECILAEGVEKAMNKFNPPPQSADGGEDDRPQGTGRPRL